MKTNNLWDKGQSKNKDSEIFNNFTTGSDFQLDLLYFLKYDIKATRVYAGALTDCKIFNEEEYEYVEKALDDIEKFRAEGAIDMNSPYEDCHSMLEYQLVLRVGSIGKKIHTGRSRNDQSLTMIRMYLKDSGLDLNFKLNELASEFREFSHRNKEQMFIGYTHTQQAMLTTLGHYYNSFEEQVYDDAYFLNNIITRINQCPLGTGAGYGSTLDLDRQSISDELGFAKVQRNSMYCQNSRGKFELMYLNACSQIMLTLQRFASDMILYTSREFSFFDVDHNLTQGSSMMPQKKNLDVFETIRAKSAEVMSYENRVQLILKGLPSGYNRDLQQIKEVIVNATNIVNECIEVTKLSLQYLIPNNENILAAIKPDIYSADIISARCETMPSETFRDLYKSIDINNIADHKPEDIIKIRKSLGSPGNY